MKRYINPFVYERVLDNHGSNPTIPVYLSETYGQCFEDVMLDGMLRAYFGSSRKTSPVIRYIDIGANHPFATSNTYLIHIFHNITGVLVEANPVLIGELRRLRPRDLVLNAAVVPYDASEVDFHIANKNELSSIDRNFISQWDESHIERTIKVPAVRINDLAEIVKDADEILLSVDVEGNDFAIIQDLDFNRYAPLAIVVEHNEHLGNSGSAMMFEFLMSKGYFLYAKTNVNLIFRRID